MPYAEPRFAAIIDGTNTTASRDDRIAAVWGTAHDTAAAQYGDEAVPGFFTVPRGDVLMAQLHAAPAAATVEMLMAMATAFIGPPKAGTKKGTDTFGMSLKDQINADVAKHFTTAEVKAAPAQGVETAKPEGLQ